MVHLIRTMVLSKYQGTYIYNVPRYFESTMVHQIGTKPKAEKLSTASIVRMGSQYYKRVNTINELY